MREDTTRRTPPSSDELLRRLRMKHFQLLSVLGRRGTLGAASETLALTQPAVSKMLREIELAFGARLFERGRRGVEPNTLGRAAIRHARTVIGEVGLLADELQAMDRGASALLRLGTFSITAIVPAAIGVLRGRMPGVQVRIREAAIVELLSLLLEGELDCAFGAIAPEALATGAIRHLRWQSVLDDHLCALVSEWHPFAAASELHWKHLAGHPWVAMPRDTVVRQRFMEAFVRQGLVPPQPVVETLSPVTVAALVREDPTLIGLARHETARQSELLAGVRRLPIAPRMPLPPLCLITRRGPAGATELLQAFVDSVRSVTGSGR